MKQTTLFFLLCLTFIHFACKKDDPTTPGTGGTVRIHQSPPAGFAFPHMYYQRELSNEFKAWINGQDVTSKHKPEDFLTPQNFNYFTIRLKDLNTMEIYDSLGQLSVTRAYFFVHDTLYMLEPPYELPLATGNFSQFVINGTNGFISGSGRGNQHSTLAFSNIGKSTYKNVSDMAADYGFIYVDTLAYYNSSVTMK